MTYLLVPSPTLHPEPSPCVPAEAAGGKGEEGSSQRCGKMGCIRGPEKQGDGGADTRTDAPTAQLERGSIGEAGKSACGGRRGLVAAVKQYS